MRRADRLRALADIGRQWGVLVQADADPTVTAGIKFGCPKKCQLTAEQVNGQHVLADEVVLNLSVWMCRTNLNAAYRQSVLRVGQ